MNKKYIRKAETYITIVPCNHGHFERYVKGNQCVECKRLQTQKNIRDPEYKAKRKTEEHKVKHRVWDKNYRQKNPKRIMLSGAKKRAKLKGLEFNLVESDIIIPKYCPVFPEIELRKGDGKVSDNSPSLDRIDNTRGYVPDNVRVISQKANALKSNGTVELFKRLIEYIESSFQEKN